MFGARTRQRFWTAAAKMLSDVDTDRVVGLLGRIQHTRVLIEEMQSVALHLVALPTRQDIRRLQRHVMRLDAQVAHLDRLVCQLEGLLENSEPPRRPPA